VGPDAWRLRKSANLVKLLALAPQHSLHREQVLDALWPEAMPCAAANSLHQALHAARIALAPHRARAVRTTYLRLEGDVLRLMPGGRLRVDVETFEVAVAAARRARTPEAYRSSLALYSGDLLPGDRYEEWATEPRERLRTLYIALLVELADLYQRQGEAARAADVWQQVVVAEPTNEAVHVSLMRHYAAAGRPVEALRQYQLLQRALRSELSTEPDAESRALREAILAGRFALVGAGLAGAGDGVSAPPAASAVLAPQPTVPVGAASGSAGYLECAAPHGGHLPRQLSSFIGRKEELANLRCLLEGEREPPLVTLVGPGGSGKTRLALEALSGLRRRPGGRYLVELGALVNPALVRQALATALGVQEEAGRPLLAKLCAVFGEQRSLLVLDNCEQVAAACAELVAGLLRACPHLQIVATSRQPLRVPGEVVWSVPPLEFPAPDAVPGLASAAGPTEAILRYDAIRLFVARACQSRPGFELSPEDVPAVAEICRRLDGLPLALELAASRVRVLSVPELASRLDDQLELLTDGDQIVPRRQQTLRATLDWSYDLLAEAEQSLFVRLGVFVGGWSLAAAEAVCADAGPFAGQVLDLLSRLIDRSLVFVQSGPAKVTRYCLLETVRDYARERLASRRDAQHVYAQHARYYLTLAEQAAEELHGPQQEEWLDRLEQEHDNLRSALEWSCRRADAKATLRFSAALGVFWVRRGHLTEGWARLSDALALAQDAPAELRIPALFEAVEVARFLGHLDQTRRLLQESLTLARSVNDTAGVARALHRLGVLSRGDGRAAGSARPAGGRRGCSGV
jgi:predicted ATPase/DNA-binding SARP family transcriptional activator